MVSGLLLFVLLPGVAAVEHGKDGLESLAWGTGRLSFYEVKYSVAGAGVGGAEISKTTFNPRWLRNSS
jgi:hypothetical protein